MNRATILALTVSTFGVVFASLEDNLALDDRNGIFSGAARSGSAAMAYQDFWLEPMGSECLHDAEGYLDYEAIFTPMIFGVEITPQMLDGFSLNTNGSLRLTLGLDGWAEGSVSIGAPPLLWGNLYDWASIHRCSGGVQEMCYACGRRHSSEDGYNCSHDLGCAAKNAYSNQCTCPPLLVKVNCDDDNWNLSEDRIDTNPCASDDEIEGFQAIGIGKYCCCHGDISGTTSVSELTASSELRLWNGTTAASSSANSFAIEAIAASSGIGSATVSYEIRDETNGFLRAITRQVTAANLEIRPDINDDGTIDNYDRFYFDNGETWQLRVRDEPYKLALVSECPSAATASLLAVLVEGTGTVIRTEAMGGAILPLGTTSTSPLFAAKNEAKELFVDTSGGPSTIYLHYSLGFGGAHSPLTAMRQIHVVDANVHEEWATTNSLADLVYDFSDVTGDIYWTIYDGEDNIVDYGDNSSFTPIDLPPGNYTVEVYFVDVYDDGILGYTSSADLHVIDVRLARLFETANEANRIFNSTRKDDTTGNTNAVTEVVYEGTPSEERYAAPRNYLYTVGDPVTGNFNVSAQFDATGAEGCTNYYCAFYQPNGQKVIGTETNIDFTAETVAFSLPAPALITNVVWELRGGLDVNQNATLDNDEAAPFAIYTNSANIVKHARIKGITKKMYEDSSDYIDNRVDLWLYGDNTPPAIIFTRARTLLKMFFMCTGERGLAPDLAPTIVNSNVVMHAFANDGSCFSEWLTHNSGAEYDLNGNATVCDYTWDEGSDMSEFIASQWPFVPKVPTVGMIGINWTLTQTGYILHQFYTNVVESQVISYMNDMEVGTVQTFPTNGGWYTQATSTNFFSSLSPSWVPGITVDVGINPGGPTAALLSEFLATNGAADNFEAHITIGRGRIINPRYRFEVQKQNGDNGITFVVTNIIFGCTVMDLYDFNYEDGGAATHAAAVQLGFGNGSNQGRSEHGKIFTHKMYILKNYPYPFTR